MCSKKKKTKLFSLIWEDPLKWARSACGTKTRMTFIILFHIIVLMINCFFVAVASGFDDGRGFLVKTLPLFGTIVFLGNLYSFFYIYVMHRLIKMLDQNEPKTNDLG